MQNKEQKEKIREFRNQLENHYDFPTDYLFKFIVPDEQLDYLKSILPEGNIKTKRSKTGKYVGLTIKLHVNSSDEIIDIYNQVYNIEGIISL